MMSFSWSRLILYSRDAKAEADSQPDNERPIMNELLLYGKKANRDCLGKSM